MDTKAFRQKYEIEPKDWLRVLENHFFPLHQTGRKRTDPELRKAVELALDKFEHYAAKNKVRSPIGLLSRFLEEAARNVPPVQHTYSFALPKTRAMKQWETRVGKHLSDS